MLIFIAVAQFNCNMFMFIQEYIKLRLISLSVV